MKASQIALAIVFSAALALRLGWGLTRPADDATIDRLPDQREYLELARNLLHGKGLVLYDARFEQEVHAYRAPGYPIFLAACGAKVRVARAIQAMIDSFTVLAAYFLARRWLREWPSVFAAALVAFNPFLIYFSSLILTETLFTAMLAWGMVMLLRRPIFGGAILALSVLVRPGAIALPVVLGLLAALTNRTGPQPYHRRWPIPIGTTMLALTLLALLPWAIRNKRVLDRWIWTSTNGGITAYDGFNPDATGVSDQRFIESMPHVRRMDEVERDQYFASRAAQFVGEHGRIALNLIAIKIARTWSPMPLSAEFATSKYRAIALAFSIPFYALFLAGLCLGPLKPATTMFLVAPAIYFTVTAAMTVGSLRYRVPAEVPISVIAASALSGVFARPPDRSTEPCQ